MSASVIREQLIEHFPETQDDESILQECISICKNYNLSGVDLFYKWEAMRFGGGRPPGDVVSEGLTMARVEDLKKGIVEELNKKRAKEQNAQGKKVDVMAMIRRGQQNNAKNVKAATFNTSLTPVNKNMGVRVSYKCPSEDRKKRKYRYMYEKISERSEVLDERIDEFAEIIREQYDVDELGDPSATSEEDIVVVGRICGDADSSNGTSSKLIEGSIFLESSRMMGSGARTLLRFSPTVKLRGTTQGAGGLGLFPGAIVALKGRNGGGDFFAVEEILGLPPLKLSPDPSNHKAFTLVAASGPYTADADLKFKHLDTLIQKAILLKPEVVLLLGPFIDSSHPLIKSGDVDQTPTEIFNVEVVARLRSFLIASPESLVLLVSSVKDILSDHPVYPQCEMDNISLPDPRIKMLPNPCRFSINDVSFATSSVDILFHLRNQEYLQRGHEVDPVPLLSTESSATDVLTNTCRHLLSQRTFYPLFPVPADLSAEVHLDISHSEGLRLDMNIEEHAPDVLILPSRLKQFTKVVDATWAINPSFATKGTFAVVTVPETTREDLHRRMKCEIVRV